MTMYYANNRGRFPKEFKVKFKHTKNLGACEVRNISLGAWRKIQKKNNNVHDGEHDKHT